MISISNFTVILDKCLKKMKLYWNKWNNIENGEKLVWNGLYVQKKEKIPNNLYYLLYYVHILNSLVNNASYFDNICKCH